MTIIYTNTNTDQHIEEGDPHIWVRDTLEWEGTPLTDLPTKDVRRVMEDLAEEKAALSTLFKDELMWRKLDYWVAVDAMVPEQVKFINQHLAACAEWDEVPCKVDTGSIRWRAKTSKYTHVWDWKCFKGRTRPYSVDYATAMVQVLETQHNMELQAAIRLAYSFTSTTDVCSFKDSPPREIDLHEIECIKHINEQ